MDTFIWLSMYQMILIWFFDNLTLIYLPLSCAKYYHYHRLIKMKSCGSIYRSKHPETCTSAFINTEQIKLNIVVLQLYTIKTIHRRYMAYKTQMSLSFSQPFRQDLTLGNQKIHRVFFLFWFWKTTTITNVIYGVLLWGKSS